MTFLSGLAEIEAAIASEPQEERVSLDYLSVPDKGTATVQPLQELDPSSEGYDETKGLAFITWYHQSPYNWKRSALCSMKDQGQCLACELNGNDYDPEKKEQRAWYARKRFYINLIVTDPVTEEKSVKVFHCSTTGQGILPDLIEWYKTNGPISQQVFTLSRKGQKRETNYTLTPQLKTAPSDVADFEPQDAKANGYLSIPYERQAKFYEYTTPGAQAAVAEEARSAATIDW
jgi:hypothetical protein